MAFMDDTLVLAWGKTLDELNQKVRQMIEKKVKGAWTGHTCTSATSPLKSLVSWGSPDEGSKTQVAGHAPDL